MRLTVDDKDLKEFKDVVLLMETATRAEEGCAASPSFFLHH
jgi:quinol monooxygenase YgiN